MKTHVRTISSVANEEEVTLLTRVAKNDRDALTQMYLAYYDRLFKFVFRLTRSYTIADELVNDIMLLVWRKASTFRGESKVSTWIFGIAYKLTMRRVTRKQLQVSPGTDLDQFSTDSDTTQEKHRIDWCAD